MNRHHYDQVIFSAICILNGTPERVMSDAAAERRRAYWKFVRFQDLNMYRNAARQR